ncbi:MAG: helix-turn-helix domain-containing protein [Micrococcales bacterium]|nr:helix-turn-helix domain-containing protein [Micrococcales bacterium]
MTTATTTPTETLRQAVARRVNEAMAHASRSLGGLAAATGLPKASLSYKLRALRPFDTNELESIGHALGVDPDYLLAGEAVNAAPDTWAVNQPSKGQNP